MVQARTKQSGPGKQGVSKSSCVVMTALGLDKSVKSPPLDGKEGGRGPPTALTKMTTISQWSEVKSTDTSTLASSV